MSGLGRFRLDDLPTARLQKGYKSCEPCLNELFRVLSYKGNFPVGGSANRERPEQLYLTGHQKMLE